MVAMRKEIDELNAEFTMVRAHGVGRFAAHHSPQMDILKLKELKGSWMAKDVDNLLWSMNN